MPDASSAERGGRWRVPADARHRPLAGALRAGLAILGITLLGYGLSSELARLPRLPWTGPGGSILLTLMAFACYAWRFRAVMTMVALRLSRSAALGLTASASFYQAFVPLSVGGDVTRFALCCAVAPTLSRRRIAGGIVLDHLLGSVALLLLAVPWATRMLPDSRLWMAGTGAGLGLASGLLVSRLPALRRRATRTWHTVRTHLSDTTSALAFSLAMQALLAVAVWNLARGWQLEISYTDILGVIACAALLQVVPLNLGGLHFGDVAAGGLYVLHGLSVAEGALLAATLYCLRVSVALVGGAWEFLRKRRGAASGGRLNP